jgi:hypothetical protein
MKVAPHTSVLDDAEIGSYEAYRLGHHLHMIGAWAEAIERLDESGAPVPWKWDFPLTVFRDAPDLPPADLIMEIHDALLDLALMKAVDPGVLIEMHRTLDELLESSVELAVYVQNKNGDLCLGGYDNVIYDLSVLDRLATHVLVAPGDSLRKWHELGKLVGRSLYVLALENQAEEISHAMSALIEFAEPMLPEGSLDEVVGVYDRKTDERGLIDRAGRLIQALEKVHLFVLKYLEAPVAVEPYLVFDDRGRRLIVFDVEIPFEELPPEAAGGLQLLRVLVQYASKPVAPDKLISESALSCHVPQLPAYISRLRNALRKRMKQSSRLTIEHPEALKNCFIVANRSACSRSGGKYPFYQLSFNASRVRYIAP